MHKCSIPAAVACALALAACGDGGGSGTSGDTGRTGVAQVAANIVDAVTPDSHGSATVRVDGQEFRFKVVQCERDIPHPLLTGQRVELSLAGVHPDTPQDIEPLLTARPGGDIDPARAKQALATAFAHGPTLSIVRMDDGAEVVGLMTSETQGWVASDGSRELTISGGRVSGRTNGEELVGNGKVQFEIEATCP